MNELPDIFTSSDVPRYCLRCSEALPAGGTPICRNCNLQYDADDPATYRAAPVLNRWKFWFPGLCLAVASGVISYAVCLQAGELGFALFAAVPFSFGAILGYATPVRFWMLLGLGVVTVTCVVCGLVTVGFSGFFCGAMLWIIFFGPASVGMFLGYLLRIALRRSRWDQRWFLPVSLIALVPYATQTVESVVPRRTEIATVTTDLTVRATPREAWDAIMFYEEVDHPAPWLLQLALPKPIRSVGSRQHVGQIVRCYYDRGYLVKRISRRDPERLLAFDVVEQQLHFERDVTLLGGSFQIEPVSSNSTQITLTTRYQRHLAPGWLWRPIESQVVHTLHSHVLEGMRRHAETVERPDDNPPYEPYPATEPAFYKLAQQSPNP